LSSVTGCSGRANSVLRCGSALPEKDKFLMMRIRLTCVPILWALTTSASLAAQARPVEAPRALEAQAIPAQGPEASAEAPNDAEHWGREVLRIGQDYTLMPGDVTGQVVVVAGNGTIEGRVDRDVVVVLGRARLSSTASINGSLIVLGGGSARIESGARVGRDLVVVGGRLDAPAQFTTGGQQIVIGPAIGGTLEGIVPWISRGLLWGRPIVPDLPWVWRMVGIFFIVYLILSLVFHQPVRASADTLAERPLSSLVIGLLVLLLAAPVCLLLAVSIIGIAVVPFVLCAIVLAWILGKVGVAQWIGMRIVHQESRDSRLQSVRSFAIGFVMISLAYMVPLLGLIAWTTVGVFGLGGATLAFIAGYRRENPAPAPRGRAVALAPPSAPYREEAALPSDRPVELGFNPSEASSVTAVAADAAAFPHAAFRDRLAAFVLDVILVAIAQHLLDLTRRDSAIFLLLLAYHIGFWTWKSTTVGGIICQLRVVRVDGKPLGFADALVRGLSSIFSLAVVGLGALWILKDSERQAWHDKIAGTYVVKVPRNWPL
jgi:uncharacterized RDD family membrane protein YckC